MKKNIILILLMSGVLSFVISQNCQFYNQEVLFIRNNIVKKDTIIVINGFMNYKFETLKKLFITNFTEQSNVDVLSFNDYCLPIDTVFDCNFNLDNVFIADNSFREKYYCCDNTARVPTNVAFSRVLFIDNKYAYFRMLVQSLNPGHFTRWVIYENDGENWNLIKSGAILH
jgi:hypothetical protein